MEDREELLDQAWERLRSGQVNRPPEEAELEPLLKIAQRIQEMAGEPSQRFVTRLENVLLQRSESLRRKARPSIREWAKKQLDSISYSPRVKGLAFGLAMLLALFLLGGGTTVAAQSSLPGDLLYPVKRATERLSFLVARGPVERADLHLELAGKRTEELEIITYRNRGIEEGLVEDMTLETERALAEVEEVPERKQEPLFLKLMELTARQQEVLRRVYGQVPEQAQPAIERAMEASQRGHERAAQAVEKEEKEQREITPTPTPKGPAEGPKQEKKPEAPPGREKKDQRSEDRDVGRH